MEHSGHLIKGIIMGALFGIVLFNVGAVRYSRVEGMLLLRDLKIMKFAFTGIATASIIYGLAAIFGFSEKTNLVPRVMGYLGIAHVIGGIMFGIAMASAGFCPGTCVARVGAGKFLSIAGVLGLVVGILVYNAIQPSLVEAGILGHSVDITLYGVLGVPYGPLAVAWGILFLVFAIIADYLDPAKKLYQEERYRSLSEKIIKGEWHWAIGGVAAGSIIAIVTSHGEYLGFSGALLSLVGWIGHEIGYPLSNVLPKINESTMYRAGLLIGVLPGALIAALVSGRFKFDPVPPAFAQGVAPIPTVRMVLVFFAGLFLALGAMIGGGCTTGAFLAAYPTLSVGSMIMSATYFVVGVITANLIYMGRWERFVQAKKSSDEVYD